MSQLQVHGDSAGEEDMCPICCNDIDLSDRNFYPCECGFQVRRDLALTLPSLFSSFALSSSLFSPVGLSVLLE